MRRYSEKLSARSLPGRYPVVNQKNSNPLNLPNLPPMATGNNPSTQPALQVFALGPALSIVDGAPHFQFGECILVRIPLPLQINEHLDVNPEILASGLPPTSNNTSPQHFAFIRSLQLVPSGWLLEVFPIVSFTNSGGALEGYRRLSDAAKETLIPLPAFSHQHLTPALFGDPLTIDGYSNPRPSFLHIVPRIFVFDEKRSVSTMFLSVYQDVLILHASSSNG